MEKYLELLASSALFEGISPEEILSMLGCLNARRLSFGRGEAVFLEGDAAGFVGLVLEGEVQIVRHDFYGGRSLIEAARPGELFAEVFACADVDTMPVSAYARSDSAVLMLDCRRLLTLCSNSCVFHNRLVKNLLRVVAEKTLALSRKIRHMSRKTTREKLLDYLSEQARLARSACFEIPFDRQELADYLGVERSAMCAEIGKLKKAGLLDCRGSYFSLSHE